MRRVIFLRSAQEDLDELWSYVAERDVVAADRLIDRSRNATRLLTEQPDTGADAAILKPDLRKWIVDRRIIFYTVASERIEIIRVLHGARDLERPDLF